MKEYVVRSRHTVPAKDKGYLPDIITQYVSIDSHLHWHYRITRDKNNAYIFHEKEEANKVAYLLNMTVKTD